MDIDRIEKRYIPVGKTVLGLVSGVGVGRIVGGAAALAGPQKTMFGKIAVYVAQLGLSGAISAQVNTSNDKLIDEIFDTFKKLNTPSNKA